MHVVNELNYPFFRYHGLNSLVSHRDFNGLYEKMSDREVVDLVIETPDDPIVKMCKHLPEAYGSLVPITAASLRQFPIFRIPEVDVSSVSDSDVHLLWSFFYRMWTLFFFDKPFEIVKGSVWDEMYDAKEDGYDEWLQEKAEKGFLQFGAMLRPHEGICEYYVISYNGGVFSESSFCFSGKELLWGHFNFKGFLSKGLSFTDDLDMVAKFRNISREEAFFQEDMYNILRWLHYKEFHGMKPKTPAPFSKFFDKPGYTDFRIAADVPVLRQ